MARVLPARALHASGRSIPIVSACEHYSGSERFIRKSMELQSSSERPFDLTMDLEDGAPVGREDEHLQMVVDLLSQRARREKRRIGVRTHDIRSPFFVGELTAILGEVGEKVDYVVIPKIKNRGDVEYASSLMQEVAKDTNREAMWPLHILIESQRALNDLFPIAAHPDVETLDFGAMDFISDHLGALPADCTKSPAQFEHALMRRAKTQIVAAALLNGVVPAHNVTTDLSDPAAARHDARRARREFGFLRMWSIHPSQIEPIIEGMAPDGLELARSIRVLLTAQDADWGPIRFEDELMDRASYRLAWSIVQRADLAGHDIEPTDRARLFG